jgi:prepilin-type processing-associated H-X9-DG protein
VFGRRLLVTTAVLALWGGTAIPAIAGSTARSAAAAPSYHPLSTSNIKDEHLKPVSVHGAIRLQRGQPETTLRPSTNSSAGRGGAATESVAATTATAADLQGFLTRPYTTWHDITSVFDHCNPDYTQDNKVCKFDGETGYRSYGVDPSFSLGYAQSPGGGNYLYYDGHNGWDYSMYYENVLASADGIVQLAGSDPYNPCFGQTVTIQHPSGYTTRYAHLSKIYVSSGQSVSRAQVIAQSGNTGCSSGPHLHFGVYVTSSWTAIDPWGWTGGGGDPWPSDPGNLWLTGYAQFPLPSAPSNVAAIAGNGSATVTWSPPSFDGGTGISTYTVTASPGGASVSVGGGTTSAVISGLSNGTAYSFTVTAQNNVGASQSTASNSVTPSGWLGQFRTVTATRILDTRYGIGGVNGALSSQATLSIPVVGQSGLPTGGVAAAVLNATVTQPTAAGFITVYPTGATRPSTSTVNFRAGQTIANLVTVPIGSGGDISVFNWQGSAHVVLDLVGWFSADTSQGTGLLHPIAPARLMDTRIAPQHAVGGGQTLQVAVDGQGGVPSSGVSAALVNLTVTNGTASSYLTAYPSGTARPSSSNLNFTPRQTISNRAIVPVGSDGALTIWNFAGSVDVVVDVVGWISDSSALAANTGQFIGLAPARVLDTRTSGGPLTAGSRSFMVAGQGGVPAMTDAAPATAVVLNVTVADPQAAGFFTLYASGSTQPQTSDVNFPAGALLSNLVVVRLGADGKVAIYNLIGSATAVVDVLGYIN